MSVPVIEYRHLSVRFHGREVLHQIDGDVAAGSLTAIVGPNGAGKSTLLRATLGLVACASGSVQLNVPRQRVAYLAQRSDIQQNFPIAVLDCVMLGFWPSRHWWQGVGPRQREQALQALAAAGLADVAHWPVGELSAGQFQRMLFVRAILQDAQLILLDEPFNAVDTDTTRHLLAVIEQWHQEGRTVMAVLHDPHMVQRCFPSALWLEHGRQVAWGDTSEVLSDASVGRPAALAA